METGKNLLWINQRLKRYLVYRRQARESLTFATKFPGNLEIPQQDFLEKPKDHIRTRSLVRLANSMLLVANAVTLLMCSRQAIQEASGEDSGNDDDDNEQGAFDGLVSTVSACGGVGNPFFSWPGSMKKQVSRTIPGQGCEGEGMAPKWIADDAEEACMLCKKRCVGGSVVLSGCLSGW